MARDILDVAREKMDKTISALKNELSYLRAGRANAQVLERITVDYYGSPTKISQIANISIPEPRVLSIAPWEANMLTPIEKAIQIADLGMNPNNDGKVVRLVFPELTEERRKDLVKSIKKMSEESKVALRNIRRDSMTQIKKMEKDSEISEDDRVVWEKEINAFTEKFTKEIDTIASDKEKEVMSV